MTHVPAHGAAFDVSNHGEFQTALTKDSFSDQVIIDGINFLQGDAVG
jgi:hypothetical protein